MISSRSIRFAQIGGHIQVFINLFKSYNFAYLFCIEITVWVNSFILLCDGCVCWFHTACDYYYEVTD